jgi:hypothetical protein
MAKTLRVRENCGLVAVSFCYDDEESIVALDGDNLFVWQFWVVFSQRCSDFNERTAGGIDELQVWMSAKTHNWLNE